ncbi:hypothetical protein HBB16_04190 [Pseudonocardia sp. MCCB 268]|nr:hypothetical protein [Pseudonocardia cytotoxica]
MSSAAVAQVSGTAVAGVSGTAVCPARRSSRRPPGCPGRVLFAAAFGPAAGPRQCGRRSRWCRPLVGTVRVPDQFASGSSVTSDGGRSTVAVVPFDIRWSGARPAGRAARPAGGPRSAP